MEIITFQMHKNLFLEINDQSGHWPMYAGRGLHMWAKACIRRHILGTNLLSRYDNVRGKEKRLQGFFTKRWACVL